MCILQFLRLLMSIFCNILCYKLVLRLEVCYGIICKLLKCLIIDLKNWLLGERDISVCFPFPVYDILWKNCNLWTINWPPTIFNSTNLIQWSLYRDVDCFSSPLTQAGNIGMGMTMLSCSHWAIWQIPPKHAVCPGIRAWNEIKKMNFFFWSGALLFRNGTTDSDWDDVPDNLW